MRILLKLLLNSYATGTVDTMRRLHTYMHFIKKHTLIKNLQNRSFIILPRAIWLFLVKVEKFYSSSERQLACEWVYVLTTPQKNNSDSKNASCFCLARKTPIRLNNKPPFIPRLNVNSQKFHTFVGKKHRTFISFDIFLHRGIEKSIFICWNLEGKYNKVNNSPRSWRMEYAVDLKRLFKLLWRHQFSFLGRGKRIFWWWGIEQLVRGRRKMRRAALSSRYDCWDLRQRN